MPKSRKSSRAAPLDAAERDRRILAALDLRSEFAALGVVFAKDFPNAAGWLDCYALGREKPESSSPSAGCNIRTGRYHDFCGENVSFWGFAAAHGQFSDWRAAREHYAAKVGIGPAASSGAASFPSTSSGDGKPSAKSATADNSVVPNGHSPRRNPFEQLTFLDWTAPYERLATLWTLRHKHGVTLEAVKAAGGRIARYRTKTAGYTLIALPVWEDGDLARDPVAYVGWNITGAALPAFRGKGKPIEWIKMKTFGLVAGGLIGRQGLERLQNGRETISAAWKVEGPSDLLALFAAMPPELRDSQPIVTNAGGAGEHVQPHVAALFAGLPVNVVHDADQAGEHGAAKWLTGLAAVAAEVRHVRLPYEVAPKHGKDLRDWLSESGNSFADLLALAAAAPPADPTSTPGAATSTDPALNGHAASALTAAPAANEADNDPHRLARLYLGLHGRTFRYWRQEWWRYDGRRYLRFAKEELAAEITATCKTEFDRLNLEAIQSGGSTHADGKLPEALKVGRGLISNIIGALEGLCVVTGAVEQPAWLDRPSQADASTHCISLANGILDLDRLLAGEEDRAKILLPHSPAWFSPISLPYAFDEEAECPKWDAFLSHNLEGDAERIAVLQEWAGYLLSSDARQQKFLFLEGEGSNGKSVYHAAIEAMLGAENVSHVPLESFGERFALYSTIGKLANIAADCGELDKTAEGILKSFTSGDPMTFDRKNLSPVDAAPTARLSIAANNRPRFSDRSAGLWRRMMVVPFRVQIEEVEKVHGMDKKEWWLAQGELPGIFNWAVAGLWRLRRQGRFSTSAVGELALADYRSEVNPARAFLEATCKYAESQISTLGLYENYKNWCKENGNHPTNERNFGKEVARVFPKAEKRRIGSDGSRRHVYFGIFAEGVDF